MRKALRQQIEGSLFEASYLKARISFFKGEKKYWNRRCDRMIKMYESWLAQTQSKKKHLKGTGGKYNNNDSTV